MAIHAYGASFRDEQGTYSESITSGILYAKMIGLHEQVAMDRIINYHRKCIKLAIERDYVSAQINTYNPAIEKLLLSGISIAYQQNIDDLTIYIRSAFIDDHHILRHQFNALHSGYFFNIYMEI